MSEELENSLSLFAQGGGDGEEEALGSEPSVHNADTWAAAVGGEGQGVPQHPSFACHDAQAEDAQASRKSERFTISRLFSGAPLPLTTNSAASEAVYGDMLLPNTRTHRRTSIAAGMMAQPSSDNRSPGSASRRTTHSAKTGGEPQAPATPAPVSSRVNNISPSALLTASAIDPRRWIVAIRGNGELEKMLKNSKKKPNNEEEASLEGTARRRSLTSASSELPLEERMTLFNLKQIIKGFSSLLQTAKEEEAAPELMSAWQRAKLGITITTDEQAAAAGPSPSNNNNNMYQQSHHQAEAVSSSSPIKGATELAGAEEASKASEGGSPGLAASAPGSPSLKKVSFSPAAAAKKKNKSPSQSGKADDQLALQALRSESVCTLDSFTDLLAERDSLGRPVIHDNYDRVLTKDEFIELMEEVVQSASEEEIIDLINKVDYEGQNVITWNELATFFISQSGHRTHVVQSSVQYSTRPDPMHGPPPADIHQSITCTTVDLRRKVILTGGTEGSVRAWSLRRLDYRGLVFSAPEDWIIGMHYNYNSRYLYVVTLNRRVYILDAHTFEVLQLFGGRPVDEKNTTSAVYAHDTVRVVPVGGVKPPSTKSRVEDRMKMKQKASDAVDLLRKDTIVTTASAFISLDLDAAPISGRGNGPYVLRKVQEGVIMGLGDPVTASCHHYTSLDEENLIFGTNNGDICILPIVPKGVKKVLAMKHVLHIHSACVNKLELVPSMNALASCSDDGKVVITSMVTGDTLREFSALEQQAAIHDFAIHPVNRTLVTIGPERQALVWEFNQDSPVAVLDTHSAPLRSCTISMASNLIITAAIDGSIKVFECNGFNCIQELDQDREHAAHRIMSDDVRQALVCFGRYPFCLKMKRQTTSSCPAKYHGHSSPMVRCLYTNTFDQIVSVDAEAMAMTWSRATGANIFAFFMKDFSDSSTMNSARIASVALDGLQRRMMTGFRNGAVVVWNIINGQAINFITAGMGEDAAPLHEPDQGGEEDPRPWRHGMRVEKEKGDHAATATDARRFSNAMENTMRSVGQSSMTMDPSAAAHSVDNSVGSREVTACGSLVRHGATFFVFAVKQTIHTVPESANFTVATSSKWNVPDTYGPVCALEQVSAQVMACGTMSGALLFYHVLSCDQAGAALWVPDTSSSSDAAHGSSLGYGATQRSRMNVSMSWGGPNSLNATHATSSRRSEVGASVINSRISKLVVLKKLSPHLLLSAHQDGTVALWHSLRRVFLGSVSLAVAGVDEGHDGMGSFLVDVSQDNQWLVFTDEGGNVHVCEFHVRPLATEEEEASARCLANPSLYVPSQEVVAANLEAKSGSSEASSPHRQTLLDSDRVAYVFDSFRRIRVFGSGFSSVSSVLILDKPPGAAASSEPAAAEPATTGENDAEVSKEVSATGVMVEQSVEYSGPIIVVSSSDKYTRTFTIEGNPIGELGMDSWDIADPSTYRLLGDTEHYRRLPHSVAFLPRSNELASGGLLSDNSSTTSSARNMSTQNDADAAFDYLLDAYQTHLLIQHQTNVPGNKRRGRGQRRSSGGLVTSHQQLPPAMAAVRSTSRTHSTTTATNHPSLAVALANNNNSNSVAAAKSAAPPVPLAIPLRQMSIKAARHSSTSPPMELPAPLAAAMMAGAAVSLPFLGTTGGNSDLRGIHRLPSPIRNVDDKNALCTIMRPSNRQRLEGQRVRGGILRKSCVRELRRLDTARLAPGHIEDRDDTSQSDLWDGTIDIVEETPQPLPLDQPSGVMNAFIASIERRAGSLSNSGTPGLLGERHSSSPQHEGTSEATAVPEERDLEVRPHTSEPMPPSGALVSTLPLGATPADIMNTTAPVEELGTKTTRSLVVGFASSRPSSGTMYNLSANPSTSMLADPIALEDPMCGTASPELAADGERKSGMSLTFTTGGPAPTALATTATSRAIGRHLRPPRPSTDRTAALLHNTTRSRSLLSRAASGGGERNTTSSAVAATTSGITFGGSSSTQRVGSAASDTHSDQTPFGTNTQFLMQMRNERSKQVRPISGNPTDTQLMPVPGGDGGGGGDTGVTPMSAAVEKTLQRMRDRKRSVGGQKGNSDPHSYLAHVSSRMYVAPVAETEPPVGSRSRDEAMAWREHIRRLQKEGGK